MRGTTLADYQQRLARVLTYIDDHLDAPLSVETLAKIASFSPYHFHRIFSGMVGETIKGYVKRLRLERAAFQLNHTGRSVTEVALEAGYASHEAFTRAFRVRFGCPPQSFSATDTAARSRAFVPSHPGLEVIVKELPALRIAYVRSVGPWENIAAAYATLFAFTREHSVPVVGGALGISFDDPVVTDHARLRFDAAAPIPQGIEGQGDVATREIPGGRYAVARYVGPYMEMHSAYVEVVGKWFPRSGLEPAAAGCLEFYLNDPHQTPPEELLTDICVPIAE